MSQSVRGAGSIIARTLVAELPELGEPRPEGNRRIGRLGALYTPVRPMARAKLHWRRGQACGPLCSWACWWPSATIPVEDFFDRLCAAGKLKMVALIAVARKLLHHPQRHPQRSKAMANSLTTKTVAHHFDQKVPHVLSLHSPRENKYRKALAGTSSGRLWRAQCCA